MPKNTLQELDELKQEIAKQNNPEKLTVTNSILVPVLENLGAVGSVLGVISIANFLVNSTLPWETTWFINIAWPIGLLIFFVLMFLRFTRPERTIARYIYLLFKLALKEREPKGNIPTEIVIEPNKNQNKDAQMINSVLQLYYSGGKITRDELIRLLGSRNIAEKSIKILETMGIYEKGTRSTTPKLTPNTYEDASKIAYDFFTKG